MRETSPSPPLPATSRSDLSFVVADLGVDKIAAIIQTGRDHGLPTYTQVREYCGLPAINSFNELNNTVDDEIIGLLRSVYNHQDDIDLVVGGLAERPLSGAVVGPTFGCLLGQQFQILKKGDRFWYENNIPPSAFTKGMNQTTSHSIDRMISFSLQISYKS